MNRISAVIIAKDGEDLIVDCLESLSFCDEIVLIDGGSKDRTGEIAKKTGAKVYEYKSDDFSKMRNFGLEKANYEWIFYLDIDERVGNDLKEEIELKLRVNKNLDRFDYYLIKRKNFYLGKYEWPHIEKLDRLFKKEKLKGWKGKLHESPDIEGKKGELNGFVLHYTHRDLESMLNKTIKWSEIDAKLRLNSNHPKMSWWRFPRVMLGGFTNSYVIQKGYKAGTAGLIESIYQAFSNFVTYARLWELQQEDKEKQ